MQFIDLQSQYQCLKTKIDSRIHKVLEHGNYIMGPEVKELEEKLANYVGVKHAITCANGTDALQLCMMVLGVQPGDAVFCPTFTFFATAEAPALSGASPIFVDVDIDTFNICPDDLEEKIKQTISENKLSPKAILAVDLFGLPANYPAIKAIAKKYNLTLIEDAAQGFGGEINGVRAGAFGDLSTTSFFPAKPLGCYGDGGAVFTDNDELADLLRSYRVHGKGKDKYDNIRIGINSRLDTIQAAILLEKLVEFPKEMRMRNKVASKYSEALSGLVKCPTIANGYNSSWAQFSILSNEREELMEYLKKEGIPTAIYYGRCMHQQTAFCNDNHTQGKFPISEKLAKEIVSLPMSPYLDDEEVEFIISKVRSFYDK